MTTRTSRAERAHLNRELVLTAARRVFVAKGYHLATVDEIALEAGFSKGVIYSQFTSKADLFLELLGMRIAERAAHQLAVAAQLDGVGELGTLIEDAILTTRADPAWNLVLIEFRLVAARDPELNARYAQAHQKSVEGVADSLRVLYERSALEPPATLQLLATGVLAFQYGAVLEEAVGADALPTSFLVSSLGRFLGISTEP